MEDISLYKEIQREEISLKKKIGKKRDILKPGLFMKVCSEAV